MIIPASGNCLLFPKEEQRRKKIYIVTQGEYSDKHVIGFCETEEEARKVCYLINKGRGEYECPANVEECYRAEDVQSGKVGNIEVYTFLYDAHKKTLEHQSEYSVVGDASAGVSICEQYDGDIYVDVPVACGGEDLALKIAADTVAKYRAQKLDL